MMQTEAKNTAKGRLVEVRVCVDVAVDNDRSRVNGADGGKAPKLSNIC